MRWSNLKNNQCPKCGKDFNHFTSTIITCPCGFMIRVERFKQIVDEQLHSMRSHVQDENLNQEGLSRL